MVIGNTGRGMHEALAGRRILIADDEVLMRDLLASSLQRYGATLFETFNNGADAMVKIACHPYDMIFLDIEMPQMSGMECLKSIREKNADVFVVIVSGHSTIDNVRAAQLLSVNGFLVKPYSQKKIEQVVTAFLDAAS